MDKELLKRLHKLMDYCQERTLSLEEQKEMDRLQGIWHEEDTARVRRLNASANLSGDYQ